MKLLAGFVAFGLSLSPSLASAQTPRAASHKPLPFSGTWILNPTRSKVEGPAAEGSSLMIVEYDGKTWDCTQKHLNRRGQPEATWKVRLVVGSPVFHVEKGEPFTFRSRIYRQAEALILVEYLRTSRGERTKNTTRYTLEEGGNTLIEDEKSEGPLGTQRNRLVLERQGTQQNASPANQPSSE